MQSTVGGDGLIDISFNDYNLSDLLTVTKGFTALNGADYEPIVKERSGESTGSNFVYTSKKIKQIKIPFFMNDDTTSSYDLLQKILNVKEPKKLVIGYFPNRYFLAVPSGSLDYEEIKVKGTGTLTFIIPDGVAHSAVKQAQPFTLNSDGVLEAKLVNNGTEWATVDYDITMNHENGYLGIISEYGAIQLGKVDEADTETAFKQVILSRNTTDYSNWTKPTIWYENADKDISGTIGSYPEFGGWMGSLSNLNTSTTKGYYGAARELVFATPVTNLYLWARLWFETGLMGQTGLSTLAFVAEDNSVLATMDTIKTDKVGNRANVIFGTPSGHVKTIPFTPSYWLKDNPYGTESRLKNSNMFDMKIENGAVRFFWYGTYYSFPLPSSANNKKIKRIQYFEGQFKGRNATNQMVSKMGIRDIIVADMKNAYQRDIVNRYEDKSKITIDGQAKKPYYNGMLRLSDEIIGSKYFKIPPGETKVQIAFSDFSNPAPTAKAYANEVYL